MHAFLKGGNLKKPSDGATSSGQSNKKSKREGHVPWVEKYRPKTVDEVAHQDEVVAVLKKTLQSNDLPNLLFYGPPGTGKTSTILAAGKELFGDMYKDRVLELNASDERGINVVREKVKKFAQLTASATRPDGKPCPPFKIVILDESDSMTAPAQAALRRTMEKHSKTTRFCLICNYVSRIIDPITSRCAKFRFKPLADDILKERLKSIAQQENIEFEDGAIDALLYTSEGDMRKAITYLQSCARLKQGATLLKQDVYAIAGVIHDTVLEDLLKVCRSDSYEKLEITVKDLMAEGHSASQLINQLHDLMLMQDDVTDKQKSAIFERLAVVDKRLMDGADEYLQIMDLCTVIMHQLCHAEK